MWKIIVGIVTSVALTTTIVVSCHDRNERARRDVAEPGYVETTGAMSTANAVEAAPVRPLTSAPLTITTTPPTPTPSPGATARAAAPPSTNDSAGGLVGVPGSVVAAPHVQVPPASPQTLAPRPFPPAAAAPAPTALAPVLPEGGPASANARDAATEPTPPSATPPAPTAGAGRFSTEAPYWGSSAFPTNPDAGAGPFRE